MIYFRVQVYFDKIKIRMQSIEMKRFSNTEIIEKQALTSSLTYWKHDLKNRVNRYSVLIGKLLPEATTY